MAVSLVYYFVFLFVFVFFLARLRCLNAQLEILTGKLVEYDEPSKLMNNESSLFGQLVKEYWSRAANTGAYSQY